MVEDELMYILIQGYRVSIYWIANIKGFWVAKNLEIKSTCKRQQRVKGKKYF